MKLKLGSRFGCVHFKIGRLVYRCYNTGIAWSLIAKHEDKGSIFHGTFVRPKEAIRHALKMYETYVMTTAKTDERLLKIEGEMP